MRVFGDLLSFLRNDVLRDNTEPYLWSDEALCACIAQAHDEYAELTQSIRDSSSEAASFLLESGVDRYVLHPAVLAVLSARVDGEPSDLVRGGSPALNGYIPPPDTVAWLESVAQGTLAPGMPRVYVTDDSVDDSDQTMTIRVSPTPSDAEDGKLVRLRIARLPLVQCAVDTLAEVPDLPRNGFIPIAHGAAAYAYMTNDNDAGYATRAESHRAIFDRFIGQGRAKARRKLFAPLSWGFGRGGSSYTR